MTTDTAGRVQRLLTGLLGILMLWAAVSKLANPTDFLGSLYAYELPLPRPMMQSIAVVLPWLELLCGLLLVAGLWLETALVVVTALLTVFVLATGQAWVRGLQIGCGCFSLQIFGLDSHPGFERFIESVGFAFFRNVLLLAVSTILLRNALRKAATTPARKSR